MRHTPYRESLRALDKSACDQNATPSAFHPHAQRNAFRRRDARLRSRSFARLESIAETQPQLHPALLRLSAMISQYFTSFFH